MSINYLVLVLVLGTCTYTVCNALRTPLRTRDERHTLRTFAVFLAPFLDSISSLFLVRNDLRFRALILVP